MRHEAPPGWRLQEHESVPSTQDLAVAAARAGGAGRLAILAREQTAGRGCHGRAWAAPQGNLNLSIVLQDGVSRTQMGMWSLLAGVALHAAVASLAGREELRLKWPNDLMLGGAKLGGILIDSAIGSLRADWVVIGMGVNIREAPCIPERRTACLGGSTSARDLAAAVLRQIDLWCSADDEAVRCAWLDRAHPVGTRLQVLSATGSRTGTFAGLSPAGELRLEEEARPLASAEIAIIGEAKSGGNQSAVSQAGHWRGPAPCS